MGGGEKGAFVPPLLLFAVVNIPASDP